jgi:hypothetical protein
MGTGLCDIFFERLREKYKIEANVSVKLIVCGLGKTSTTRIR